MTKYQPKNFENKWIDYWEKEKIYQTNQPLDLLNRKSPKQYILSMFPYPSGEGLHVGHVRIYTGTDVLARFFRMNGYSVLHPMGWDAFGLPAENAAIKAKKNPMDMVPKNIANFKRQMKMLGFSYDWEREFSTTDPEYYKWTQWLFIQFFKMGLLYKKNAPINYCPKCKTGLAEEEVLADGTHERCGNKITKKELPQWIFAITKYADRLLSDLEGLDWPEGILAMQKNWIGRKEGINITYNVINEEARRRVFSSTSPPLSGGSPKSLTQKQASSLPAIDTITCFTTRPDTNFGATFIVVAPEHKFVEKILNPKSEIRNKCKIPDSKIEEIKRYVEEAKSKTEIERETEGRKKTGVFTGFYAINNLNGRLLPIYISDFVLMGFGTGAVVGVPGHDKRDFEFAKEFNLPVLRVVVKKIDYLRSYLIGADKIKDSDLEELKIKIVEKIKGNVRKIEIPKESFESYKKLIKNKLSEGFWNEVVGEDVWFLFKFKNGKTKEYILNESNKDEIAKHCSLFNKDPIDKTSNIWLYLASNNWYMPVIIQEEEGTMINSEFLNGMDIHKATKKMMDYLEEKGWGKRVVTYHLRDWIFSRQRYWGEPIPMMYCKNCAENKIDYWNSDLFKNNLRIGIFFDNANIFYGQKKSKLKIDIKKIKKWFSKEGKVISFKYFIAVPKKNDSSYKKTIDYLEKIKDEVEIITKPLKYIKADKDKIIKKGDVDLELAISVIDNLEKIDVFVIFSGDSDYVVLRQYLLKKGKKVIFVSFKENISWEIKKGKYILINDYQEEFCFNKKTTSDKSRGLLLKLLYPQFFGLSRDDNLYGWFPIPEDQLPLKLPYVKSYEPTETGESPLSRIREFINTTCPNCGAPAKRETDTMPNWAGSCWYFLAFAFANTLNSKSEILNSKQVLNSNNQNYKKEKSLENLDLKNSNLFRIWNLEFRDLLKDWLPVDWYLGGAEHAVLHLLYARFWVKALYDLGLVNFKEPFLRLRNVGMVLAEDHRKMSKSFGNVINPDDVVAEYGADALRLYEMFMAPFNTEIPWSTKALQGCYRFLKRVWELYQSITWNVEHGTFKEDKELVAKLNKTIKKVTEDIKQIKFNTAIASMMEFMNEWEGVNARHRDFSPTSPPKGGSPKSLAQNQVASPLSVENAKKFLQILAPFAPFMTEEIWREIFGEKTSIHLSKWPEAEEVKDEEVVIPVQVNGKLRATIKVERRMCNVEREIEKRALENERVKKYLEGKRYKMIYVEGKVVNFVLVN